MKQRIARTIICMITIYLVMMAAMYIRRNRELIQASNIQNAKRYEQMSKQMAAMFDELQKDTAPADLGENFIILEVKANDKD